MPIPKPANWSNGVKENENPWTLMNEFAKTVIGLSSSILAVTVTFSGNLIGTQPSRRLLVLVFISWAALIASIISAMVVTAALTNYLRGSREQPKPAPGASNLSFFLLVIALVCFSLAGIVRLWPTSKNRDISAALALVSAPAAYPNVPPGASPKVEVQSMAWDGPLNQWTAEVTVEYVSKGSQASQTYRATVNSSGEEILRIERVP